MEIRHTNCGDIIGIKGEQEKTECYKGIRYATAERWKYPEEITKWEGIYDATKYMPCCYQPRYFQGEAENASKTFYYNEFRKDEKYDYSEDCLFLNIWTPEDSKEENKLPVIIYIHGGNFIGGCGQEKHFDGPIWTTVGKGAIAVTVNYRLGPLGFLELPELKEEAGSCGNYGLWDQMTAIQWIKHNIAAFGGNPENITVMGQSAGAMCLQHLCGSKLTDGLFQKAIMSSGGGACVFWDAKPAESKYDFWKAVMEKSGATTLEEFRNLTPEQLFIAWDACKKEVKGGGMACFPVIDGKLVTEKATEIQKAGKLKNIPYIIGSNSEDIITPAFYLVAKRLGKTQKKYNREPVYQYFFERQLPGDEKGAWHSADLWYWFGTMHHGWRPFTGVDRDLSKEMARLLVNFAYTGDPNSDGSKAISDDETTEWPEYARADGSELHFGDYGIKLAKANVFKLTKTFIKNQAAGE